MGKKTLVFNPLCLTRLAEILPFFASLFLLWNISYFTSCSLAALNQCWVGINFCNLPAGSWYEGISPLFFFSPSFIRGPIIMLVKANFHTSLV